VGKGGLNGNIIRITPPMCITKADMISCWRDGHGELSEG
jgi:hypothetical protein